MKRKTSRRAFISDSLIGLGAVLGCTRTGLVHAADAPAAERDPSIKTYRELHCPSPGPGVALWLNPAYAANTGLVREEILTRSSRSDAYVDWQRRRSEDNGRTWSEPEPIKDVVRDTAAGGIVVYASHAYHDPASGRGYRFNMMRQWPGQRVYSGAYVDHVFVSEDEGPLRLLRYEPGADYNPDEPFEREFLDHNHAYCGNAPAFAPDGTVYFPVCIIRDRSVVLMRRDAASGQWRPSNPCAIASHLSSRGLLEPEAAVLQDGRILIVCRGSNTSTTPGRKWRILSQDKGQTLEPVEAFGYEDSEPFYSPSSIHRFVRSRRNGVLYWFANITPEPPNGNSPRYPLYITEIDETRAAVRRHSLIVLDTRQPGEPSALQLSNFHVLQDRQSDAIEIYITLLGLNPDDFWRSGVYRYVFSPPNG